MSSETPQTPRQELEARLTALLLGELSADQAAALREIIAHDAALAGLHARLQQTIDLVRQTAGLQDYGTTGPREKETTGPRDDGTTRPQPAPLRLSEQRREKLLAHFKTVTPKGFEQPRRKGIRWLDVAAVAALVMLLVSISSPTRSSTICGNSTAPNNNGPWRTKSPPATCRLPAI